MADQTANSPILTRFIAFYSYKGGVGRTLSLANCARALAKRGKKIVLMDFDLEAPGLLHFDAFKPKSNEAKPSGFAEYLSTCLKEGPPDKLDGYIHECRGEAEDKGKMWIMPAGRHREPDYLDFLNHMTWSEFYTLHDGYKILENLRGHMIHELKPDYVFIDSRTGLSEIGGIATHQLAEIVVLVFNLNGQNMEGAKRVFDSIRKAPLSPEIILVASPVPVMPTGEGTPFDAKMKTIKKDFQGAYNSDPPLIIPYHPLLSFDDRLLVDEPDLFGSTTPYERLIETIQEVSGVDADYYLQKMNDPIQRSNWTNVIKIALEGISKNPGDIHLLTLLAHAYSFINELEKSLSTLDELISFYIDSKEVSQQTLVTSALMNKAITLGQLNKPEEAIAVYDELIQRFGESEELAIQERVAKALMNKAITLGQLNKPEEGIAVYDELIQGFSESKESAIQEQVASALYNKGVALGLSNKPEEAIAVFDLLIQRFSESKELAIQEQVASALYNKGVALGLSNKPEEAIAVYDELVQRFGESEELAIQERVAKALMNKAITLGQLNKPEEGIAVYDELIQGFSESKESAIQEQVASALYNKGVALGLSNKPEEAIAVFDLLIQRFSESKELAIQEQVASALYNKGVALGRSNKPEEEIAVYDELIQRFGESEELAIQERVAKALMNKAVTLGQLNKPEEAIVVYDELIQRFGESEELAIQEQVAGALLNKGVALGRSNKPEEAIAVYDDLIQRFSGSNEWVLQEKVAYAMNGKGFNLLILAKSCQEVLQRQELFNKALDNLERSLIHIKKENQAIVLGNQAYALFLLGRVDESEPILTQALNLGGQELYEAELEDSKNRELPEDEKFRSMLDRLWKECQDETASKERA